MTLKFVRGFSVIYLTIFSFEPACAGILGAIKSAASMVGQTAMGGVAQTMGGGGGGAGFMSCKLMPKSMPMYAQNCGWGSGTQSIVNPYAPWGQGNNINQDTSMGSIAKGMAGHMAGGLMGSMIGKMTGVNPMMGRVGYGASSMGSTMG